jgi:putative Holliday junction resolvase
MIERIMALDVGDRRIGVAMSDPLGLTAQPFDTIQRTGGVAALQRIAEIADSYMVAEIVIGIPYSSRGELTAQAEKIVRFADRIASRVKAPVVRWDERHTTQTAERALLEADTSRARRRLVRDQMSAVVLLQDYLEARKRRGHEET